MHENAHQWWGDNVSIKRWRDICFSECSASYTQWLWRTKVKTSIWPTAEASRERRDGCSENRSTTWARATSSAMASMSRAPTFFTPCATRSAITRSSSPCGQFSASMQAATFPCLICVTSSSTKRAQSSPVSGSSGCSTQVRRQERTSTPAIFRRSGLSRVDSGR
ncbi:MAG: M1 family aminopeptidase [Nocardioidaceae bacterium]